MTVDVNDVVRVVAEWDIPDGTIAQLVYHFIGVSGSSVPDSQVLTSMETALTNAWLLIDQDISDQVLGSTITLYLWDFVNNRWDGIGDSPLGAADGLNVTDMVSHGVAALIKIGTAALRRQARKYVMGYCENNLAAGTITPAAVTNLALFGSALDDNVAAGTLTLSFCTFNTDPLSPLFETASIAAQSVGAEAIASYQRRRRPGTGI